MMDLAAEARSRRFQELGPHPQNKNEIYGSATHHCAICPMKRHHHCMLTCAAKRKKINVDGVIVTVS